MISKQQKPIKSGFHAKTNADEIIKGVDLSNKVAIVTGGYSGIGLEATRELINAGAKVIIPAKREEIATKNLQGIVSKEDIIELSRSDTIWSISGNDTLIIKKNLVKNLFKSMNELQKLHLVTSKKSNWARYGISDTLGTHLALIDENGLTKSF